MKLYSKKPCSNTYREDFRAMPFPGMRRSNAFQTSKQGFLHTLPVVYPLVIPVLHKQKRSRIHWLPSLLNAHNAPTTALLLVLKARS